MSNLPSGYTELMYIQSTGTQYINTEFVPNGNTRIQITFSPEDISTQAIFCGGRAIANGTDAKSFSSFYISQKIRRDYFGVSKTTTSTFPVGTKITIDANKNKTTLSAGNGEITDYTLSSTSGGVMPMLLLASSYQGVNDSSYYVPVNNLAKMKLYSCKIWGNDTLARDFVPCNYLGVIGLYDKVNNKFYNNAQSNSAFIPGPPVVKLPSGYTQVNYIESDGSSWCGTGLTINKSDNFTYYLNAELTDNDYYSGANGYLQFQASVASGDRANIRINYQNIVEKIYVNEALYSTKDWTSYTGTDVKIGIFKMGDTNDSWYNAAAQIGKIYHLQVIKDNTIIRNFIPCSYNSSYGFYDTVGKQFYPSVGNGNFTGGTIVISNPSTKKGQILNYPYTGAVQSITLPAGEYKLEVWGAQGGSYSTYYGGAGGYSVGTLTLTDDSTTLYIYVGGQPTSTSSTSAAITGGFNGGGAARVHSYSGTTTYCQAGGGGTDIRLGQDSLYARVIVAGGGGGSASINAKSTKYGGGVSGGSPTAGYAGAQTGGGTQGNKGTFGVGGAGYTSGYNYKYASGGGGGGWYGGSGYSSQSDNASAYRDYNGGGSGYVYTAGTASNYPSGCLLNSAYYLADAQTIAGNVSFPSPSGSNEIGHSGNGYARITVLSLKSNYTIYPRVNGEWKTGVGVWIRENGIWKSASTLSIKYGNTWYSSGQGGAITPNPSGYTLGNLEVGSIVKMNVNNTPQDFLIVHQGLPSDVYDASCDGTWLLMKDIYEERQWHSSNVNNLENSTIHSYLNGLFLNLFNSNIKNAIKSVKIRYRSGGGKNGTTQSGANGLSCKIFLLSGYEVGWTTSDNQYFPVDGVKLSYFESGTETSANNKRLATYNGSATNWWLRSPHTLSSGFVWLVRSNGDCNYYDASNSYGIRPALILPSTTTVGDDNLIS